MIFTKDIAEVVESRFNTSNYELDTVTKREKKLIGLMKDESGGKIMKIFLGLRGKTYSYLIDDGSQDKKAKGTKKCVIKRTRRFENQTVQKQLNLIIK